MTPQAAREVLELMLGHLGFVFEIEEQVQKDTLLLNIKTREPGRLIGRDGHTLGDLQYLLNRLIHGQDSGDDSQTARVVVDVEGYRQKEQEDFMAHVLEVAARVKRTGKPERLAPMNSFDRRLVHQRLQQDPELFTHSEEVGGHLKAIVVELKAKTS
jgi:spoIIIJ-associated protein